MLYQVADITTDQLAEEDSQVKDYSKFYSNFNEKHIKDLLVISKKKTIEFVRYPVLCWSSLFKNT